MTHERRVCKGLGGWRVRIARRVQRPIIATAAAPAASRMQPSRLPQVRDVSIIVAMMHIIFAITVLISTALRLGKRPK